MCGIFWYSGSSIDRNELFRCFNQIQPRGPDNSHVVITDRFFMGFHRLKIHDLTDAGDQPMYDQGVYLMTNGEIYNYKELIEKYSFNVRSSSDCEVILHMYLKLKNEYPSISVSDRMRILCEELDGEFAFIIFDKDLEIPTLFAGRDRYGVRPLFIGVDNEGNIGLCSELKGIDTLFTNVEQFHPSTYMIYNSTLKIYPYFDILGKYDIDIYDTFYINKNIQKKLIEAVRKRISSDVPICALLSGGLDSSLICGILTQILGRGNLHTFSIGLEGSTDIKYAKMVADHIGSIHHEVIVTEKEMLDAIPNVVKVIESYDITTVRASVPHYLLARYIRNNTEFKVVFSGEGSDELFGSYLYFKKAPTEQAFHDECNRLLQDLCYFDNLRTDRCISNNGLEARVPFLDHDLTKFVQSIHPSLRTCSDRIEKGILRYAFESSKIIPDEILWRTKAAFSDAVSKKERSWHKIIQEYLGDVSEATWFKSLFDNYYRNDKVIPYIWLPRWCGDVTDPSARELAVYTENTYPTI